MQALYKLFYSFLYNIVGNQILNISAVSAFFIIQNTGIFFEIYWHNFWHKFF